MKNYLLKPKERLDLADGKYFLVKQREGSNESILADLWSFVKDKFFLCIHLMYDPEKLIRSFDF